MSKNDIEQKIDDILGRGVVEFVDPEGKFKEKLLKKAKGEYEKDLIIKLGVDPTRPDIHLGHACILRKLRAFQDLGCKVIFIVGDYTAQIGDPTGKSKVRPELEQKEIEANMKTFVDQVGKILLTDKKVFSWIRNSDWFTAITDLGFPEGQKVEIAVNSQGKEIKISHDANSFVGKAVVFEETRMQRKESLDKGVAVITLRNFLWTLRNITHSRLIERDMFQDRLKGGTELYMHEMMYPVLQGIDSFALSRIYGSCDLEIGGTDQTFNMLVGRDVQKMNKVEEQAVMTVRLLEGTDGNEKMSKSLDNYIAITEEPNQIYGKVMSIPDKSILNYFELATYTGLDEIKDIKKDLGGGKVNPKKIKMRLAKEITAIYHGEKEAEKAEQSFEETFAKGKVPEDIKEVEVERGKELSEVLLSEGLVESKTDFRRLLESGAIKSIEGKDIGSDPKVKVTEDLNLRIGKHRFIKIKVKKGN